MKILLSGCCRYTLIALTLLGSMFLLSCGQTGADCPSGTYLANFTDKIQGPLSDSETFGPTTTSTPADAVGPIVLTPLVFTVLDANNVPRNNICVQFYSDGTAFAAADSFGTYLYPLPGARIVQATDENGNIYLYWMTEALPFSNPPVAIPAPAAGADKTGTSFVQAYSGSVQYTFNYNWTVKGRVP